MVQCYSWFKFYFPLFLGMVMYDNEFETKGNKIQTKDKIEPQHVQRDQFASETQHAAKTVHAVSKTLLLLLWYVLTLTALLF